MSTTKDITSFALVVEDSPRERELIGQALQTIGLEWKAATTLIEAAAYKDDPGIVLLIMDLLLPPNLDALDALGFTVDFRQYRPEVPVVIFSIYEPRPEDLRDIVAARAGYFFRKASAGFEIDELANVLKLSRKGVVSYSGDIANSLPSLVMDAFSKENPLSRKEWSVLALICQDLSADQIADRLGMRPNVVRSHKSNIYDKLEAKGFIKQRTDLSICDWFRKNRDKYRRWV